MQMDDRKQRVLQAIIDDYIATAEPIGSRTIARKYNLGVSPATIRNEMADLEMLGYLEQPHTSAGRIPSPRGYRFYVDQLMSPQDINDHEMALVENWYKSRVRKLEEVFQESAKIISKITKNVSIVLAPPQSTQTAFKYVQFLPLEQNRCILVVVTDKGIVENKIITVPEGISISDLQWMAAMLSRRLEGLTFDQIKAPLLHQIKKDIIKDENLFRIAMDLLEDVSRKETAERVYLGGTVELLSQPEFHDIEKVKNILRILEEERLLYDLLSVDSCGQIEISIGQENRFSGIQDCSMITARYTIQGKPIGTLAVLGPTRMEYSKIVALMKYMTYSIERVLNRFGV